MTSTRTAKEMWELHINDELTEVLRESDSSYRHGTYEYVVLKDEEGRFWAGAYTLSGDGEHNEWRDDNAYMEPFTEVFEHKVIKEVITYEATPHPTT